MRKGMAFYCFSPPVMLATFVIEISLLVYTCIRYKMTPVVRVASTLLLFLAIFQLAEYNICGNLSTMPLRWSQIGFVATTLMPVLGIHMAQLIAGKRYRLLTISAYLTAVSWVVLFASSTWAFNDYTCGGNYIIFHLRDSVTFFYSVYYYAGLSLGIWLCLHLARQAKARIRQALYWQVIGYLVFLVPTAVANSLNPETTDAIPSIMCGFAVLFACIVVFAILPRAKTKMRN